VVGDPIWQHHVVFQCGYAAIFSPSRPHRIDSAAKQHRFRRQAFRS